MQGVKCNKSDTYKKKFALFFCVPIRHAIYIEPQAAAANISVCLLGTCVLIINV